MFKSMTCTNTEIDKGGLKWLLAHIVHVTLAVHGLICTCRLIV